VLQEGEFEPVGSSQTVRVDVRVIAATNRDLGAEAKAGKFREDLYYRLNVFPIEIPALRERAADISLLATHFAQRYAAGLGRAIAPLSEAQVQRLRAYPWPGNVRELQNVIERAVITAREGRLNLERALGMVSETDVPEASQKNGTTALIRTVDELQDLERENIIRALESTNWKVSGEQGAAALLKMKPSTLNSRMKALGITRPGSRGG
jgi:transcriptional regulator with GAF, ATPase, and Fis domain